MDRSITPEKEALILRHLEERTSIRGICRVLSCSPNTVYAILKNTNALPDFEASVLPAQRGDSIECDEIWTFLGNKDCPCWIWPGTLWVWSFQTTQVLSFSLGGRDEETGALMLTAIPSSYSPKPIYTDGYLVYPNLIVPSRHHACEKDSGQTNIAEGGNTYLRHRISYLVRRSASFARNIDWLFRRLFYVLFCRNDRIAAEFM